MDTILFVLLIGAAAFLRWFSQRGERKQEQRPQAPRTNVPPARSDSTSDEERVRRFLEALGQPPGSQPPQQVQPRRVAQVSQPAQPKQGARPRRDVFLPTLPPLKTAPSDLPPQAAPAATTTTTVTSTIVRPAKVTRPTAVPMSQLPSEPVRLSAASTLQDRLHDPTSIRQAIILREILDPPRAFRPLEFA